MNKTTKKISVSVGIPAYNEEANIGYLLEQLLVQKLDLRVVLKEIIVVSDGSTDTTVKIVKSINSPLIKVIEGKERLGQQVRQNQLLSLFMGEVLVFIEGDTVPYDDMTLNNLVTPLIGNNTIGMVVGHAVSLPSDTFVEKIEAHGMRIKDRISSEWRNGDNIYSCSGHAMKALSKKFVNTLYYPHDVPEDSYTYLRLKQVNLKMKRSQAKAYVKRVAHLYDYNRRYKKFIGGKEALKKYFSRKLIDKEFTPPINITIKHVLLTMFRSPILTFLYLLESVLVRMLNVNIKEYTPFYKPFTSTKNLRLNNSAFAKTTESI